MSKLILFFALLVLNFSLLAQEITIQVIDRQTENPVSFVKIHDGVSRTYVADIDGKAKVDILSNHSYTFRFFEYKDTVIKGADLLKQPMVILVPEAQVFSEVVVHAGENPAHRIIQNVMNNRKKNDPLKNNSFTYESYSKLFVTGELKEGVIRDTITDSSALQTLELLDRQYLFLVETKANRTFNPPNYDKEEITAYNVSGVKEPLFATIINQFQSFSFYDNNFELNQKEYINPLAPGGLKRYLFIIEDTLYQHGPSDSTFVISYRPRKGKNFDGLSGYLYINSTEWALERVITSPYKEGAGASDVKITQEYEFMNGTKWFPRKVSTELLFPIALQNYGSLIGRSSLYVSDVKFDEVKKRGFNPVSVEIAEGALADSSSLKNYRGDTYTGKEDLTYVTVDSIAKELNFERALQMLKILATGKVPVSVISFPLDRVFNYNEHEGIRLGLGVETNDRLSKVFKMGGYFAYGFKDKAWKWGGDMSFMLYRERQVKLNFDYHDDVRQKGLTEYFNDGFQFFNNGFSRDFFLDKMDRERSAGVSLSGMIRQNLQVELLGNYKRYTFLDQYQYMPLFSNNGTVDAFDQAEVGIAVEWNIMEKVMMLEGERISLGTKWPKLTFKATKGFTGLFESRYDYYRLNLEINQTFKFRAAGSLSLASKSGMTLGNVPLLLTQEQIGTGINFEPSVMNTFETMSSAEFFNDKSTALFVRYTFVPIKNKTSWTEPLFGLHTALGYGTMSNVTDHRNFDFKTMEKGYYESGVVIDNLLKVRFIGIGAGVFYRYGPYQLAQTKDNFFYKLSFKFNLSMN